MFLGLNILHNTHGYNEVPKWYHRKLISRLGELIFGFFQKKKGQGEEKVLEKVKRHRD